jgi:hypothetical protein
VIRGSTSLERGRPVLVLAQRSRSTAGPDCVSWLSPPKSAPRNVLMVQEDGERAVRPFRGLRRALAS